MVKPRTVAASSTAIKVLGILHVLSPSPSPTDHMKPYNSH